MMADATVAGQVVRPVERLREAINDHDLDALAGCFTEDYAVDIPAHPRRSFRGRDQVRRNWAQILAAVPDLSARLVALSRTGDTVWGEWDWVGTRVDGGAHHLRGVTILGLRGELIAWSRFYMEPV